MAEDQELFNGEVRTTIEDNENIAFRSSSLLGSRIISWLNFKNLLKSVFVALTGDQTISGVKTYNSSPKVPDPTTGLEAVNLRTLQDLATGTWTIQNVSSDVNPASAFVYYKVDARTGPVTIYLPNPTSGAKSEYYVELRKNTHKVTITTVSGVSSAIQGNDALIIPNVGGIIKLKADELSGYKVILDTRNMNTVIDITADRDFTTDGFEHKSEYKIKPSPAGSSVLITLPPPQSYDADKSISASFKLSTEGTVSIIRSDGGFIGSQVNQDILDVDTGITISESKDGYSIIQDSRPKPSTSFVKLPAYRLDEISDIPTYYSLSNTKNDPRYGAEVELVTPPINLTTPSVYISYVTDLGQDLGEFTASTVNFFVTTKQTSPFNRNVIAYYELFKRTALGVETLIVKTSEFIITQSIYQQFQIAVETPNLIFAADDRLVMKVSVYKNAAGGDNPTLTTLIEGDNGAYFAFNQPSTGVEHNNLLGRDSAESHPAQSISYENSNVKSEIDKFNSEKLRADEIITIDNTDTYTTLNDALDLVPSELNGYKLSIICASTETIELIGADTIRGTDFSRFTNGVIEIRSSISGSRAILKNNPTLTYSIMFAGDLNNVTLLFKDIEFDCESTSDGRIGFYTCNNSEVVYKNCKLSNLSSTTTGGAGFSLISAYKCDITIDSCDLDFKSSLTRTSLIDTNKNLATGHSNIKILNSNYVTNRANYIVQSTSNQFNSTIVTIQDSDVAENEKSGGSGSVRFLKLPIAGTPPVSDDFEIVEFADSPHTMVNDIDYKYDATGGAIISNAPASYTTGVIKLYFDVVDDTNTVTLQGNGNTIDGNASIIIGAEYDDLYYLLSWNTTDAEWNLSPLSDTDGTSGSSSVSESNANTIRSLTEFTAGADVFNYRTGAWYEFNPTSTAVDNNTEYSNVLKPYSISTGDPGRFIRRAIVSLSNLLRIYTPYNDDAIQDWQVGQCCIITKINTGIDVEDENNETQYTLNVPTKSIVTRIGAGYTSGDFLIESIDGGSGGGHVIQEEGTPLTQRANLNFVGKKVTATDDAGNDATIITVINEIPEVGSGEKVVTKESTGVNIDQDLVEQDAANSATLSALDWSSGQVTSSGVKGQWSNNTEWKYECIGTNTWVRTLLLEDRVDLYLSPDIDDSGGAKTSAQLDTAYPSAEIGQRVWGTNQFVYEKKASTIWRKTPSTIA